MKKRIISVIAAFVCLISFGLFSFSASADATTFFADVPLTPSAYLFACLAESDWDMEECSFFYMSYEWNDSTHYWVCLIHDPDPQDIAISISSNGSDGNCAMSFVYSSEAHNDDTVVEYCTYSEYGFGGFNSTSSDPYGSFPFTFYCTFDINNFHSNYDDKIDLVQLDHSPSSGAPIPFDVILTPEPCDDMTRTVSIIGKGPGNTEESTTYDISVRMKLSDDFIEAVNPETCGNTYGNSVYGCIPVVAKSPITDETDLQEYFENEVLMYSIHRGDYYYGDNILSDSGENKSPYYPVAKGFTPIYNLPRDQNVVSCQFYMDCIDFETEGIEDGDELYISVIGILGRDESQTLLLDGENSSSSNDGSTTSMGAAVYASDFCKRSDPFQIHNLPVNIVDDTHYDTLKFYDTYCYSSSPFSYEVMPEFNQERLDSITLVDKDGKQYSPTQSPLSDLVSIRPDQISDIDLKREGRSALAPDEYDDYSKRKTEERLLNNSADSFSFDTETISSLFDGDSDLFKFLTSSISIFPPAFLQILLTFFGVFLVLVLIKFVI